jgi:hypothetical protein
MVGSRGMVEPIEAGAMAKAEEKALGALIQREIWRENILTAYIQIWRMSLKMGIPKFMMQLGNM